MDERTPQGKDANGQANGAPSPAPHPQDADCPVDEELDVTRSMMDYLTQVKNSTKKEIAYLSVAASY